MQNLEKEVWKTVEEHPNYYVSNLGRVFSVKLNRILEGHILKRGNYKSKRVELNCKEYLLPRLVAKAFPEICGEWFNKCEVHHLDFNPLNNRADNLKVCTKEEHDAYHYEIRAERARAKSGANHYLYGKKMPEETKRKMVATLMKRWENKENTPMWGKHHTEETKAKIRKNSTLKKKIMQYSLDNQFIKEWDSTMEIERVLGFNHANISAVCLGKHTSAYGYIWKHKTLI